MRGKDKMKIAKEHNQLIYGIFRLAMSASLMAAIVSCATQPVASTTAKTNANASPATVAENRLNYDQYLAQGKSALNSGNTTQAIDNFKQALREAGSDATKQQEAYGNIGLAYQAASDNPTAQAYLEKAGAKEQAPAWIKDGYKHLLSSQKFMTSEDMERKLQAEKDIEQEQAQLLAANQDNSSEEPGSKRRGFIVGKPAMTTAMNTKEDYRPKPAEAKSKPKVVKRPKHPGPAPMASAHADTQSAETALDIRIIFAVASSVLTPEGQKQADELGKLLQQKLQDGDQVAVLVGHTDILGSEEYNDHLSEERANAVKSYLVSKFPDLKGKLSERGMGKRQPIYKEMDEESQRLNRRVEVKLSRSPE